MRFVAIPNFIAVSTCSLDFFEALLQLLQPAPLSGLFFVRALLGTAARGYFRAITANLSANLRCTLSGVVVQQRHGCPAA